jgi:hypothetical protein
MLRFLLVAGAIGFGAALLVSGCGPTLPAVTVTVPTAPQVQITVHPWEKPLKLVAKLPKTEHFKYVGRVRALSKGSDEFVEAAHSVQDRLRQRARALGADVVKIDGASADGQILALSGRAYRSLK